MNSKVIYTSIVGGYDPLCQPVVVDESFDYICFTNDVPPGRDGVWEIRPIPVAGEDNVRLCRKTKLLPHTVLSDYEWSVWVDANIIITSADFYTAINRAIESGDTVSQLPHIQRDCIYEEALHCCKVGKAGLCETKRQLNHLKEEGFPRHFGLFENNILVRKHNDKAVVAASEMWWSEVCNYTTRDQFSLMYVLWKCGLKPGFIFDGRTNARNASCLDYKLHQTQQQKPSGFQALAGGIKYRCKLAALWFLKLKFAR